ncbi:pseudouridine synthase [Aerococcus viridans]
MLLGQLIMDARQVTRKECKRLLKYGLVTVDQVVTTQFALVVDPAWQVITVDQHVISSYFGHTYYLVHKPKGYLSANKDQQYPTVIDLIQPADNPGDLAITGRLDRDAHGLVFVTNNGQLHYIFQQPKFDIPKTYRVSVNGLIDGKMVAQFQAGVIFEDGTICKAARLEIISASPQSSTGLVTISEGRRHQVKKMFLACGVKVTDLYRQKIGDLRIDDLAEGDYRQLNEAEIQSLKSIFPLYNKRKES